MYAPTLKPRDRGGAIAAVIAIHAGLLFALMNLSGQIDVPTSDDVMRVFEVNEVPPPPQPEPPQIQETTRALQRPKDPEGAASPENLRSQATEIVAPKPQVQLPVQSPVAITPTPNLGAASTQGAGDRPGLGTGAGGIGTGTGSGGSGSGFGGGGDNGVAYPPRLLTPVLRGRDFPPYILDLWPRGAQVFVRFRIDANGQIIECFVDRGTGVPAIDTEICNLTRSRFRYRPALNRSGQAVAGWAGYRQTPPQ